MELWFWAALGGMFLSGFSNFIFKLVARNNFNSEIFSLYGGISSVVFLVPITLIFGSFYLETNLSAVTMLLASIVAAFIGVWKVYALRYIDTTIYFPLFKLLGPFLAIVIGVFFFAETFSTTEWVGLALGLLVPLMLITRSEHLRQNNLMLGLFLTAITATLSAAVAAVHKWAIDLSPNELALLFYGSVGIIVGSLLALFIKKGIVTGIRYIYEVEDFGQLAFWAVARSIVVSASVWCILFAYSSGGPLGIVITIHSMYILIPIVLAIIFYNEHWNLQKAAAIVLSVASLALLG